MRDDLIRVPRPQRAPLAAVARRIGFAVSLVLFVALVAWLNRGGYEDGTGESISFLDALYYASVTVTTTGYGDISAVSDGARLASILLIMPARIVFLILVVGTTVEVLTDQSREFLATRRWRKNVNNHVVICGFGSTGQSAAAELLHRGVKIEEIVIVDTDGDVIERAIRQGHVAVHGNATRNEVLREAAVDRARAVIVSPNRDDTAVLTTLTVRELNPTVHIVAGGREQENMHLLRQGGADEVIDATAAVGRMLGLATTAPGAVGVLDDVLDASKGLELREVTVQDDMTLPAHSTVLAVIRGEERLTGAAAASPKPGDRVVLLVDHPARNAR